MRIATEAASDTHGGAAASGAESARRPGRRSKHSSRPAGFSGVGAFFARAVLRERRRRAVGKCRISIFPRSAAGRNCGKYEY